MMNGEYIIHSTPVVEMTGVSFSYLSTKVIDDVTFKVEPGDFVSIVGPNGGGKTTLLKLMLGLLKPDKGVVRVFGSSPERVRKRIGYMTQQMHFDLQFPISVLDIVLMGRLGFSHTGRYSKEDHEVARYALEQVGLGTRINSHLAELSGGQRQRVLLARAISSKPDLLLLDEPTANIDIIIGGKLFDILKDLSSRVSIILVSHDLGFVSQVVNKVLCVNRTLFVHPTSMVTGEVIHELYGSEMKMVRHDHHEPANGTIGTSPKQCFEEEDEH